jgi:phage baseplate assembly protein W
MSSNYAITLPFSFNIAGGISNTSDVKKIWQDRVVLAAMSYLGERVMRPRYGTNIRGFVFENEGNMQELIKNEMISAFSSWLSELTLDDVTTTIDPIDNILNVSISYSYGTNLSDSVIIRTTHLTQTGDIISEA